MQVKQKCFLNIYVIISVSLQSLSSNNTDQQTLIVPFEAFSS